MSFGEITFTKSTTQKSSSQTVTDKVAHPIAHFLGGLGLDISEYPKISVLLETKEHIFKNTQTYLVIRIPGEQGLLYESVARIKRIIEIPSADLGDHRKFIEIEWFIDEQGLLEEENHPAFAFLSSEVECPKCKAFFVPDAGLKTDQSLEIACPSCLMKWEIKVDSSFISDPQPKLLSEYCAKDPEQGVKLIKKWQQPASGDADDRKTFFLSEFSHLQESSSLDWFFGEQKVFSQHSSRCDGDFELLWRSFFNYLMETHLKTVAGSASQLDHTEIFRKSELARKEGKEDTVTPSVFVQRTDPSQIASNIETIEQEGGRSRNLNSAFEAEFGMFKGNTDVRSLSDIEDQMVSRDQAPSAHPPMFSNSTQMHRPMNPYRKDRSWIFAASLAASLLLFTSLILFMYLRSEGSNSPGSAQAKLETQIENPQAGSSVENSLQVKSIRPNRDLAPRAEEVATTRAPEAPAAVAAPVETPAPEQPVKEVQELETIAQDSPDEIAKEAEAQKEKERLRAEQAALKQEQERQRRADEAERSRKAAAEKADREREQRLLSVYDEGMSLFNRENYEQAIGKFKEVINIDPRHAEGHRNLGLAYVYSEQYDAGRATLETYLSLAGPNADTEIQSHVRQVLSFIDSWSAQ